MEAANKTFLPLPSRGNPLLDRIRIFADRFLLRNELTSVQHRSFFWRNRRCGGTPPGEGQTAL